MSASRASPILLSLILAPAWAQAQTCSFSVTNPISFGNLDTLSGAPANTTGTVNITCGGALVGANVRVCLNINQGSGGNTSSVRHMRNAINQPLNYQLHQNSPAGALWGSRTQPALGTPVAVDLQLPPGFGNVSTSRTIYAQVLGSQQSVSPDLYTSLFSGTATGASFNWRTYNANPPNCGSVTQNPNSPSFTVQANVLKNCSVTAQNINFGEHGVLDANVDATGGVGVTCTPTTSYTVGLNNGLTGGSPTTRRMTLGSEAVIYGLYKDAARSQPWGNSGGQLISGTGVGTTQSLPVYGRVQPQATPPPGTYTDTVVVTVTY